MLSLDVFNTDPFGVVSLTDAVDKIPFKPGLLGSMSIFTPNPIETITFGIEERQGVLSLIQTSRRGAPPTQQNAIRRKMRNFDTVRIAKDDQLHSHEIQGIRAFGSQSETEMLMSKVAQKQSRLIDDHETTLEYHRLGAVQGITLDADGSTLYNWFTEFGISQPSEITFSNSAVTSAGGMRAFIAQNIVRPMARAIGATTGGQIVALVGDNFFDWLVDHADVKATYANWAAAADLRQGMAFEAFTFGGVMWVNYRGTDDNSTVAIGATKAKFFMSGIRGLFQHVMSPAESFDFVNTPGRALYSQILNDPSGRNAFVTIEVASYPMLICTRPESLLRGTYS